MIDFIKQLKSVDGSNVKVFNNIKDAIKDTTSEMKKVHNVIHDSLKANLKQKNK